MSYKLRMERLFDAPPEVVFDTYVDPDAQEEMWDNMVPGWKLLESEIDLRVGGTWKLAFGPPDGKPDRVTSVFAEIDRPHGLVTQESTYVSEYDATTNTTVRLTFEEQGGRTLLRIFQTGFQTEQERDGIQSGWPSFLDALQRVVAARATVRGGGGNAA